MANFTTGTIDLSTINTFDNVIMGNGDVMNFSNTGTGGGAGQPIKVTGNFTVSGTAIINLRVNTNLAPGTVSIGTYTRDLNAQTLNYGTGGSGSGGGQGGNFRGGQGGNGGSVGSGSDGGQATYSYGPPTGIGGTAGAYPGGFGGAGSSSSNGGTGGGGGGTGQHGQSVESVCFYVEGDINISGGTINGTGTGGGSGGGGGHGYGNADLYGGEGGGGAGGAGGHGGRLFLYHLGTKTGDVTTKNLSGGTGGGGGYGASKTLQWPYSGTSAGGNGTAGGNGNTGGVYYIETDIIPNIMTGAVSNIFARQVSIEGELVHNGGVELLGVGIVYGTSPNPDISGGKSGAPLAIGTFSLIIASLDSDTQYYARAYATNTIGTAYGEEITFKTHNDFIPKITQIN